MNYLGFVQQQKSERSSLRIHSDMEVLRGQHPEDGPTAESEHMVVGDPMPFSDT